jgi:UDP-N-acetylmuramoylalanine--D-glutamate ligase
MIPATSFHGRKIAVFGLGLSGLAAGRALLAGGADVAAWDDSEAGREAARKAALPLCDLREADWRGFDALALAPGVPLTHPEPHWTVRLARQSGVEVMGDTEIFCRELRRLNAGSRMAAITGTNGKSTTTALTQHLLASAGLRAESGGNIGRAVFDLPPPEPGLHYVLEFSSFQLDLTPSLDADAAALLNISPDHLDRHGTIEHYASVKASVFRNLRVGGTAIVGVDDEFSRAIAASLAASERARLVRISATRRLEDGIFFKDGRLVAIRHGEVEREIGLGGIASLRGAHNGQNAAAAAALARSFGLQWSVIERGLKSFPGLPHRMEEVGRLNRVLFINDSKATNADAAARALACFADIYWIVGGRAKAGGLAGLDLFFPRIRKAYLIGEAAADFARTLEGKVPHVIAGALENALALAARDALADASSREPVVLLSPACASYDQFPNFTVRGDRFREAVSALKGVRLPEAAEAA